MFLSENSHPRNKSVIMKVLNFVKLSALPVISRTYLFADTYKLEVTKDKQTIRFCVHNLTRKSNDWFPVKKAGSLYESGDSWIGGCIWGTKVGTDVGFSFGSFYAKFDDKNNRFRLNGGCFADMLRFENSDFPMVAADATAL